MRVGEGWVCWVQLANMWQHCSLTAVQRKTAFVEESWWPEFNLFGSMPWCSFPRHKILPRLTQNNCYTVYSLNLIHEFTSVFSTNLLYVGLPRKAFPGKQAKVDTGHQCFSVVAQATPQDSPKASPMAIFKWKNLIGQLNPLLEWMLNESWRRLSLLSSTCQHVATLQFDSCAEKDSLCRTVMMAWISHFWINAMVFVPMAQAPPKADAKELLYSLQSKFDPWVYIYIHLHPCFQPTCFM